MILDGRKICCNCDFEEKDLTRNIVRVSISPKVNSMIRIFSERTGLPISSILREVLENYKNKSEVVSKIDTEDYSKKLAVKLKNDYSVEEYQKYADEISNQDIISILNEIYNL